MFLGIRDMYSLFNPGELQRTRSLSCKTHGCISCCMHRYKLGSKANYLDWKNTPFEVWMGPYKLQQTTQNICIYLYICSYNCPTSSEGLKDYPGTLITYHLSLSHFFSGHAEVTEWMISTVLQISSVGVIFNVSQCLFLAMLPK